MPSVLANGSFQVLLHPSEILSLSITPGGSIRVVELDSGGGLISQQTYTLNPVFIGAYSSIKILNITAINGTVTYNVSLVREETAKESSVIAQSGAAIVTANSVSEQTLVTIPILANAMGSNGSIQVWTLWSLTNNANVKTLRVKLGSTNFWAAAGASFASLKGHCQIFNRASLSSQVAADSGLVGFAGSASAVVTGSIDTSVDQVLTITAQKATGTDTCTLEAYLVRMNPWFI